jgi:hypothetical protein
LKGIVAFSIKRVHGEPVEPFKHKSNEPFDELRVNGSTGFPLARE